MRHHQSPDQSHLDVCVVVEVVAEGVVVPHLHHAHLTYTIIKLKTTITCQQHHYETSTSEYPSISYPCRKIEKQLLLCNPWQARGQ